MLSCGKESDIAYMYDAFVSYSRNDLSAVNALKAELDRHGLRVFLDVTSLRGGKAWPIELGKALNRSRVLILCWSAHSACSDWVNSEVRHSLIASRPPLVLPWLLDSTPLPPLLQYKQGFPDAPAPVVEVVLSARKRDRRHRLALGTIICAGAIALMIWFTAWEGFSGHVTDEQGLPISLVNLEAEGTHAQTNMSGTFKLSLFRFPYRSVRVTATKYGYQIKSVLTQSDQRDLGMVLERTP